MPMQEQMPQGQEQEQGGQDAQSQLAKMVSGVSKGIQMTAEAMQASGVPEDLVQEMAQLGQAYQDIIQRIESEGSQANQTMPQEAGGAQGARPAM